MAPGTPPAPRARGTPATAGSSPASVETSGTGSASLEGGGQKVGLVLERDVETRLVPQKRKKLSRAEGLDAVSICQ